MARVTDGDSNLTAFALLVLVGCIALVGGWWRARRAVRPRVQAQLESAIAPLATGAGPAPTPPMRQDRAALGRYRVEREIGRGAMGAVLLARDLGSGRFVALKTVALGGEFDQHALAEVRQRFLREAETAGRLRHPDIVAVCEAGEDQGLVYMAMEYVQGHDLQRHTLQAGLLPVPVVLHLAARVADALAYAHRQGVVHRDIKPANVMIDLDADTVKVMDFGIARIADSSRTRTGVVLGTPSFMSPEQLAGQRVDGPSDLYSLGVMLFQLLCARLPHEASSMAALMSQIAHERAPDIRSLRPDLPEALADLVARVLEKRPELRPSDGHQLALDLRRIAASVEACAAPRVPPEAGVFVPVVKFSRDDPGHNSAA